MRGYSKEARLCRKYNVDTFESTIGMQKPYLVFVSQPPPTDKESKGIIENLVPTLNANVSSSDLYQLLSKKRVDNYVNQSWYYRGQGCRRVQPYGEEEENAVSEVVAAAAACREYRKKTVAYEMTIDRRERERNFACK